MSYAVHKARTSCGVWGRSWQVALPPRLNFFSFIYFFKEVDSRTHTNNLPLLVDDNCHHTKAQHLMKLIKKEEKIMALRNSQILRLCLIIVFVFYFQKLVFEDRKKKTIFLYFWNQKLVWLVEIKKIVFWRKKICWNMLLLGFKLWC